MKSLLKYAIQVVVYGKGNKPQKSSDVDKNVRDSLIDESQKLWFKNHKTTLDLLVGGVHRTSADTIKEFMEIIQPKENEIFMEVGIGLPALAYVEYALTKTAVVATDLRK